MAVIAEEVLKQIKLPRRQIQHLACASTRSSDDIHLQVGDSELCHRICLSAPQQGSNPSQQLRECKWLYEIVISAAIQPQYTIFG